MNDENPTNWNQLLANQRSPHILQLPEWAALKSQFGWSSATIVIEDVGVQVLFRKLPLGFSIGYVPKAPLGPPLHWHKLWEPLDALCKKRNAIFLKIEPDAWDTETDKINQVLTPYALSAQPIQPRRTVVIDITGSPDDWLARMKQKTRYNIRLAEKKEVHVSESDDVKTFQTLMDVTGARNEFGVHSFAYYQAAYQLMAPDHCTILQATYQEKPLAAIMVFHSGYRAWYFYGASSNEERNRMPTYLLQYEAMKWAAAKGCQEYDLWGIPDYPEEQLESEFSERSDGLWGVYRFKRGFGGNIVRSVGAYDRIFHPGLYKLYQRLTGRINT